MSLNITNNLRVWLVILLVVAIFAAVAVVAFSSFDVSLLHHDASSTVDLFSSMEKTIAGGCVSISDCTVGG
ncbi:MAG: hypothetical protein KC415_17510 [Anaerolineales bacterium]|nr:hypothetical protein [Anaerolineales bacterium]MCB8990479.1 hypothetical protein [Ardenticatenaceae bacterium]MCB9003493.1 hypothetical protein [Ardenticatenaceae bacterium]